MDLESISISGIIGIEMHTAELSQRLGEWSAGKGPLYARLANAIAMAIYRGDLMPGERLPAERELARALAISRTTVIAAYAFLRDQQLLEARQGSGTRVDPHLRISGPLPPTYTMATKLTPAMAADVIDCSDSVVHDLDAIADDSLGLTARDLRQLARGVSYEPLGLPVLRSALARRYAAHGLPTSAEQILITTGAQQAIDLVFELFGANHGTVIVEDPTYFGALDSARRPGINLLAVPRELEGPSLSALAAALKQSRAQVVYLMTEGHNPTGAVTSQAVRAAILRHCREAEATIVDDATLGDLHFSGPVRPFAALPGADGVITIGSLSKILFAGLRVGWIRAPVATINRLARRKVVADLGSSHLSQLQAARLVEFLDSAAAARVKTLRHQLGVLTDALRTHLPEASWTAPAGGPVLWVRLPHGDAESFSQLALRHGVRLTPGAKMSATGHFIDHVRISFTAPPDELVAAALRLGEAWRAYDGSIMAQPPRLEVVV